MQTKNPSAESDPTIPLVDSTLKGRKAGAEVPFETLPRGPRGLLSFAFDAYDPAGNRTSMTDHAGTHSYGHDDLHRLITAAHPPAGAVPTKNENFDYDGVGNRKFDANITGYQYDAANRLLENSSFTYAYDGNGNQTGKTGKQGQGTTIYTYNAENQLIQADMPDGTRQMNAYDGLGRRIENSTGTVADRSTVRYVYDNEDILAMQVDGGAWTVFTHGPGADEPLLMKQADGAEYYYHTDVLGSVVALSDDQGEVIERIEYEAYGKPTFINADNTPSATGGQSLTASPYAFTGREWDPETGLHFYRARYYDQDIGMFLQEDLIDFLDGWSRYLYVYAQPTRFTDPSGAKPRIRVYGPVARYAQFVFDSAYGFASGEFSRGIADAKRRICAKSGDSLDAFVNYKDGAEVERERRDPKNNALDRKGRELRITTSYLHGYSAIYNSSGPGDLAFNYFTNLGLFLAETPGKLSGYLYYDTWTPAGLDQMAAQLIGLHAPFYAVLNSIPQGGGTCGCR